MKITVGHLFPDLLNLYGDSGNIAVLRHRLEMRGIEADIREYSIDDEINFEDIDIIQETKDYYKEVFGLELTNDQAASIFAPNEEVGVGF